MQYLISFSRFNEEVDLQPKITDEPNIKMSKENLAKYQKYMTDYKQKKPLIDKAYLTASTEADLKIKVEQIVGKTESLPKEDRNPFLVEYLTIANMKRKIDQLQKSVTNDKLKKDDFSQEMGVITDAGQKQNVQEKIDDISTRMSTNIADIASLKKEIETYQKKLDDKITKMRKELTDFIKKITTQSTK